MYVQPNTKSGFIRYFLDEQPLFKKTWTEVVQKDCQACKLNREDATDAVYGGSR